MILSGYAKRSLIDKLGIKPHDRILVINPPRGYFDLLGELPESVTLCRELEANLNVIQVFVTQESELLAGFTLWANSLVPNGMLWVSWPKLSSKKATDLNENNIR